MQVDFIQGSMKLSPMQLPHPIKYVAHIIDYSIKYFLITALKLSYLKKLKLIEIVE